MAQLTVSKPATAALWLRPLLKSPEVEELSRGESNPKQHPLSFTAPALGRKSFIKGNARF
jgi:hypothetical protein